MLQERLSVSERRACRITGQHRSTQRHRPRMADRRDDALRARLRDLSRKHPRWGYRRAWASLRGEGWEANRKKIQRLWREEGLRVPPRRRKRQRLGISTLSAARLRAERPDQVWALDFQFDTTTDGRILKLLHVVDEHTREALAIEVARRIDADRTVEVLDRIVSARGRPPELVRMLPGEIPQTRAQRVIAAVGHSRPMPLGGAMLTGDPARPPLRHRETILQHRHRGSSARRAHQFPFAISFKASISSSWSATIRFSLPFSRSNPFSRLTSSAFNPPYC